MKVRFSRDEPPQPAAARLQDILRLISEAGDGPRVSVASLIDALGTRAFGPLLLVPSLILVTPISGIPGAPTFGALIILLVAVQIIAGSRRIWLPDFVRRQSFKRERLKSTAERIEPTAVVIDRLVSRRLAFLMRRPFNILFVIPCAALALAMPPLEFVPMSSTILASGIFLLALSLTAQDGLLGLLSLLVTGTVIGLALKVLF